MQIQVDELTKKKLREMQKEGQYYRIQALGIG